MTADVLNPVQIEQAIRACSERIHKGVHVVTERERDAREKRRLYDQAYARSYLQHEGAAHEKRYAAELATAQERAEAVVAEVAFRHAERTARAVEAELRAWQSVGASVRLMYGAQS